MPDRNYFSQYRGSFTAGLPPGYMAAATEAGRNIGAGIADFGKGIGQMIDRYRSEAKVTKAARTMAKELDPDNADRFETMSGAEVTGWLESRAVKQNEERQAVEYEMKKEQLDEFRRMKTERELANKLATEFEPEISNILHGFMPMSETESVTEQVEGPRPPDVQMNQMQDLDRWLPQTSLPPEFFGTTSSTPTSVVGQLPANRPGFPLSSRPKPVQSLPIQGPMPPVDKPAGTVTREWSELVDAEVPLSPEERAQQFREYMRKGGVTDPDLIDAMSGLEVRDINGVKAVMHKGRLVDVVSDSPKMTAESILKLKSMAIDIPSANGMPALKGETPTSEEAVTLRAGYSDTKKLVGAVDELIEILDTPGGKLNPVQRAKVDTLIGGVIGAARLPFLGPGVMTDSEREWLGGLIGNPNRIFAFPGTIKQRLTTFRQRSMENLTNIADSLGVQVDGGGGGQPGIPTRRYNPAKGTIE